MAEEGGGVCGEVERGGRWVLGMGDECVPVLNLLGEGESGEW